MLRESSSQESREAMGAKIEIETYDDLPLPDDNFHGEPQNVEQTQKERIVEEVKRAYLLLYKEFQDKIRSIDSNGEGIDYQKMLFEAVSPGNIARWRESLEKDGVPREEIENKINQMIRLADRDDRMMVKIIARNVESLFLSKLGLNPEDFQFIHDISRKNRSETTSEDTERLNSIGGQIANFKGQEKNLRVDVRISDEVIVDNFGVESPGGKGIIMTYSPRHSVLDWPAVSLHLA